MDLITLTDSDRSQWNTFVAEHFSPVGAFLQSWEWGDFKGELHGEVTRYAIIEKGGAKDADGIKEEKWIACFQLETHKLPFGFKYGYAPRGPVLRKDLWDSEEKVNEIFLFIAEYFKKHSPELIFVRLEPAHVKCFSAYNTNPFRKLREYLQPRFNQLIPVNRNDDQETVLKAMSADIRHDIRAAERLGVTIEDVATLNDEDARAFEKMKEETRARSGKNIFPSDRYFKYFLESFKHASSADTHHADGTQTEPYVRYFIARKDGVAVAINLNVIFAKTLTYLYGASYSGSASKRAPAYLHWKTMHYAAEHGLAYYDLGGVDDATSSWQGLSYFKKQFGGETLEYVGTVNAVMRPTLYELYVNAKKSSSYLSTCWKMPAKRKR